MVGKMKIVFAGGGTGGHIYPGIAVADELSRIAREQGRECQIYWIGNNSGMDKNIVEKFLIPSDNKESVSDSSKSITKFYGIPCGKLRRYFSIKNFFDVFKIVFGLIKSFFLLLKIKPDFVFSKGGFVSVPPCMAAKFLHIPYFTHECDATPGLATRLNAKGAKNILVSYDDTINMLSSGYRKKSIKTGNPVRPVFFKDSSQKGKEFLNISDSNKKPVVLVLGGSLGALQVNNLIAENINQITKDFIVVHQTGRTYAKENPDKMQITDSYKPFEFIYDEMPSVIQAADIIISRAGANSICECSACGKPMILVPLCGSGTRGDQVDNAKVFEKQGAAYVLMGEDVNGTKLMEYLNNLKDVNTRKQFSENSKKLTGNINPATTIAQLILNEVK